jgi:hypothetical protein
MRRTNFGSQLLLNPAKQFPTSYRTVRCKDRVQGRNRGGTGPEGTGGPRLFVGAPLREAAVL